MHLMLLLACVLPIQEEQVSSQADRLSPAPLKRRVSYEIETPEFLDDRYLVASPEEVLMKLQAAQQKAWDEIRTVKGRAWLNFIYKDPNECGTVVLLDFSIAQDTRREKILMWYQNKAYEEALKGNVAAADVGGQDPDSKDAFYCPTALIFRPDMLIHASGFQRKGLDDIEIKPADAGVSEPVNFLRDVFQYRASPREFFENTLPDWKKRKYQIKVKAKDEFVEISILFPKPEGKTGSPLAV